MGLACAGVVRISKSEAQNFMQEFEHLGNVGLGVWHYGLLLQGEVHAVLSVGVPCFSHGRGTLADLARNSNARLLQLCRGGTSDHAPKNTGSRAISLVLEALESEFGPALVVAYADPHFGEVGTIYQACNAVYTGWTDPKGQANYIINGRRLSGWTVRKRYGTRDMAQLRDIDPDVRREYLRPKMRYVMMAASGGTRRALLRDLRELELPYPKRDELGISRMMSGPETRTAQGIATGVLPAWKPAFESVVART